MSETTAQDPVLFAVRDGIASITLNRPQASNAVNMELARTLHDAARRCGADPTVRAVVITGQGKAFCAGGDLKGFSAQDEHLPEHIRELLDHFHAAISHLAHLDAPVIAAINGVAAGAGMSLACACDLAIAAESARFTMAYTRAGLSPDGSSTYFLPRLVGLRRALDLTLTNRMLSATEALDWGIVTRVVPDDTFQDDVNAVVTQIAAGPTRAFGAAKHLLRASWNETLETQMAHELHRIAAITRTADAHEGIAAFTEKRPPRFTGQ